MEKELSPSQRLKRLERYVYNLKAARELNRLEDGARDSVIALRTAVSAARVRIDDYYSAETTAEKAAALEQGIEQLREAGKSILLVSQHELVSPADVAQLSAMAEHIIDSLE